MRIKESISRFRKMIANTAVLVDSSNCSGLNTAKVESVGGRESQVLNSTVCARATQRESLETDNARHTSSYAADVTPVRWRLHVMQSCPSMNHRFLRSGLLEARKPRGEKRV